MASTAKVVVTDVFGNELIVLCDKKFSQGSDQLNLDARTLDKGLYFCNVIVNGKSFTKKIVKL